VLEHRKRSAREIGAADGARKEHIAGYDERFIRPRYDETDASR
jgi:hypothetical protein